MPCCIFHRLGSLFQGRPLFRGQAIPDKTDTVLFFYFNQIRSMCVDIGKAHLRSIRIINGVDNEVHGYVLVENKAQGRN